MSSPSSSPLSDWLSSLWGSGNPQSSKLNASSSSCRYGPWFPSGFVRPPAARAAKVARPSSRSLTKVWTLTSLAGWRPSLVRGRGLGRSNGTCVDASGGGASSSAGKLWSHWWVLPPQVSSDDKCCSLREAEHCVCVEECVTGRGCVFEVTLFVSEELTADWLEVMLRSSVSDDLMVQGGGGRGGLPDLLSTSRNRFRFYYTKTKPIRATNQLSSLPRGLGAGPGSVCVAMVVLETGGELEAGGRRTCSCVFSLITSS